MFFYKTAKLTVTWDKRLWRCDISLWGVLRRWWQRSIFIITFRARWLTWGRLLFYGVFRFLRSRYLWFLLLKSHIDLIAGYHFMRIWRFVSINDYAFKYEEPLLDFEVILFAVGVHQHAQLRVSRKLKLKFFVILSLDCEKELGSLLCLIIFKLRWIFTSLFRRYFAIIIHLIELMIKIILTYATFQKRLNNTINIFFLAPFRRILLSYTRKWVPRRSGQLCWSRCLFLWVFQRAIHLVLAFFTVEAGFFDLFSVKFNAPKHLGMKVGV